MLKIVILAVVIYKIMLNLGKPVAQRQLLMKFNKYMANMKWMYYCIGVW